MSERDALNMSGDMPENESGFFGRWRRKLQRITDTVAPTTQAPIGAADGLLPSLVVDAERIARQLTMGVHGQRRAGSGEDFWQYRPAEAHEPASRIDWRQSARGDALWVREREAEGTQQVMFWCDPSASMDWRSDASLPTKRARAMLCTLALASAALRGGERAGLMTGPEAGRHFSGNQALPRLAAGLTTGLGHMEGSDAPPHADLMRAHGQLVIVSDFLWPLERLEATLNALSARPARTQLLCILDPAERSLPYRGRVRFDGLENEGDVTLSAVEVLSGAYDAALTSHLDALRSLAGAHRATLTIHETNHSPMLALLGLYARLSGGRVGS